MSTEFESQKFTLQIIVSALSVWSPTEISSWNLHICVCGAQGKNMRLKCKFRSNQNIGEFQIHRDFISVIVFSVLSKTKWLESMVSTRSLLMGD